MCYNKFMEVIKMRIYFKLDDDDLYIDVPNRFRKSIEYILKEYNDFYDDRTGDRPITNIREECNIFNYGKTDEN